MPSDGGGQGPSRSNVLPQAAASISLGPASQAMNHFWSQAAAEANPRISQLRRRLSRFPSAPLRIQRVSQLDAEVLDGELLTLLVQPLKTSLAYIKRTLPDRIEPELIALLKLVLFKYSIWDNGATYGAMLQNLRYRNEWVHRGGLQSTLASVGLSPLQLSLYPLLKIGVPYLYERLERHMASVSSSIPSDDPRRIFRFILDKAQRTYETAALINFVAFLSNGKFRTLTDRILGMRLIYNERTLNRNVSFEFLNRQLVWHAFTEFLLFLLPIIRPRRLLRKMLRLPTHPRILAFWLAVMPRWLASRIGLSRDPHSGKLRYKLPLRLPFISSAMGVEGSSKRRESGKYADLPNGICAICWHRIEEDTAAASSSVSMESIGIPSSNPLDPSSGALAPSAAANFSATPNLRTSNYHNASRAFGVSQDGVPYSNALIHTAYVADPCGCEYCYVCLAEKLLSEEAGEELENSKSMAWTSEGYDGSTTGKAPRPKQGLHRRRGEYNQSIEPDVGAWDCSRCGVKVRGMHRALSDNKHDEDPGNGELCFKHLTEDGSPVMKPKKDADQRAVQDNGPLPMQQIETKLMDKQPDFADEKLRLGDCNDGEDEELDLDELAKFQ